MIGARLPAGPGASPDPIGIRRFVAVSVGHPTAYVRAGLEQKRKGMYVLKMAGSSPH